MLWIFYTFCRNISDRSKGTLLLTFSKLAYFQLFFQSGKHVVHHYRIIWLPWKHGHAKEQRCHLDATPSCISSSIQYMFIHRVHIANSFYANPKQTPTAEAGCLTEIQSSASLELQRERPDHVLALADDNLFGRRQPVLKVNKLFSTRDMCRHCASYASKTKQTPIQHPRFKTQRFFK